MRGENSAPRCAEGTPSCLRGALPPSRYMVCAAAIAPAMRGGNSVLPARGASPSRHMACAAAIVPATRGTGRPADGQRGRCPDGCRLPRDCARRLIPSPATRGRNFTLRCVPTRDAWGKFSLAMRGGNSVLPARGAPPSRHMVCAAAIVPATREKRPAGRLTVSRAAARMVAACRAMRPPPDPPAMERDGQKHQPKDGGRAAFGRTFWRRRGAG